MRIPSILFVLLFGLASQGAAQASDPSQAALGSAPPRIVLQLPRFPKLPELQPILPVLADPDSDGVMPPRIVLQLPLFLKLQPELQPVMPVLAIPDSHIP